MAIENRPHIVGVVNNPASLETALSLDTGSGVDILEVRLDAFHAEPQAVLEVLPKLSLPLLITARHPEEGGYAELPADTRRALLSRFLPHAQLMDLELRSSQEMPELISQARHASKVVVLSFHDFRGVPRVEMLEELAEEALERGAHIFKVAVTTNDLTALTRLIRFAERVSKVMPTALMGMGKFGMASRLLLAQSGSLLNYGSLGGDIVSGQWQAQVFAQRLRELLPHPVSAGKQAKVG